MSPFLKKEAFQYYWKLQQFIDLWTGQIVLETF